MADHPLSNRLSEPGPKRLLALDGGGLRALVSLGFLARIEMLLRDRYRKPDLVLSDYFDLIGGTSSGAVVATALTLGWPVERIRHLYRTMGRDVFRPRPSWFGPVGRVLGAKFDEKPLEAFFRRQLGDLTLDAQELRVGLMIIVKRVDTGSVWVLINIPENRYYELNRGLHLWEVLRSSTAAPTFFAPRSVEDVGHGEQAIFVDGGVSMHNDPALQLLMVAALDGFGLRWPLDKDRLLLCSVGTGSYCPTYPPKAFHNLSNLHWASLLIAQLMSDARELNQTILQWLSVSPTARPIDGQIGTLEKDLLIRPPLLSYLRYDVELEREALASLGVSLSERQVAGLREMSNVRSVADLDDLGHAAAAALVEPDHFPIAMDRVLPE